MADHRIYQHLSEKKETRLQNLFAFRFSRKPNGGVKLPEQDLVA